MSSPLADRLRGIVRYAPPRVESGPAPAWKRDGLSSPDAGGDGSVEALLDGTWVESGGRRFLVTDRAYGPGHRHGRMAMMDAMPPWPRLSLLGAPDASRLLFVDVETTGLAGGAGTYAFLVGCAWFDGATFRVRQLFLSSYSAEAAVLEAIAELARGVSGVVTFNGKSFDLPLIETRFLFHRMQTPFAGLPHVDMLHPARRLWRDDDPPDGFSAGCRLSVLERELCGVAREGDVPGFEIPARYFHFVRSGDARPLRGVLEHNRLDLISLALLTARASQLLDGGPASARTSREALGLGRLYERAELYDLAREAYAHSADLDDASAGILTEALRSYAVVCRRQRRFADAAIAWQRLLGVKPCPPRLVREATEALAIHHEHRLRDPGAARRFAVQCLGFEGSVSRQHAVRHRLARLERKLAVPATPSLRF